MTNGKRLSGSRRTRPHNTERIAAIENENAELKKCIAELIACADEALKVLREYVKNIGDLKAELILQRLKLAPKFKPGDVVRDRRGLLFNRCLTVEGVENLEGVELLRFKGVHLQYHSEYFELVESAKTAK